VNGVHDMGGMQGFGPVRRERDEPVFHAAWEGRVIAMRRLVGAIGKVRQPGFRAEVESLPPAEYLSNSYYENWLAAFIEQLLHSGVITREELACVEPGGSGAVEPSIALPPEKAAVLPYAVPQVMIKAEVARRFRAGDRVRARNINPTGHTRLPRYVRGKVGVVQREMGVQALADTNAYDRGENPQLVYSVRFAARELWGEEASPLDGVYVDLWDEYLEHA
jgi:nitrile hydratase beta subunit